MTKQAESFWKIPESKEKNKKKRPGGTVYVGICWKCKKVIFTTYPRNLDASTKEERGVCTCKKFAGGDVKRTLKELKYYCKDCSCYYWYRHPTDRYKNGIVPCEGGIVCPIEEEKKKPK